MQVGLVQRPWGRWVIHSTCKGWGHSWNDCVGQPGEAGKALRSPDLSDSQENETLGISCLLQKSGVTDCELTVWPGQVALKWFKLSLPLGVSRTPNGKDYQQILRNLNLWEDRASFCPDLSTWSHKPRSRPAEHPGVISLQNPLCNIPLLEILSLRKRGPLQSGLFRS